jgi:hypothetical protein
MGRGLMMGVDHNKGLAWVGAAAVVVGSGENYVGRTFRE